MNRRRPVFQQLESRQLLAADVFIPHNVVQPDDIDGNGIVAPVDALRAVNRLAQGVGDEVVDFLDVNADGRITPVDPLIVINNLERGGGESNVPVESRINWVRNAIEAGQIPESIGLARAHEVLETLELGGRPELGEIITTERLELLKDRATDGANVRDIVFETLGVASDSGAVEATRSALERSGIDIGDITDTIDSIIGDATSDGAGLIDGINSLLNDLLGGDGGLFGRLNALVKAAQIQNVILEVESVLNQSGVEIDALYEQLQAFIDEFDSESTPLATSIDNLIDSAINSDGNVRNSVINLLDSAELDSIRSQVEGILNAFGIDTLNLSQTIEQFITDWRAGGTPIRDAIANLLGG